ncbi:PAS domain S-box protein [Roseomonas sp. M0104]|uniref:histidine kinase n=1 Tax=Teichococcus coralli TaxID=2545983 RepID=A0A845BF47_9PROT|nr:PAS domain-containing protein [Pseudoroseomonas coralli]MXP64736.1 PAS domain S-box protein [Pseudoroseomonas coralli]
MTEQVGGPSWTEEERLAALYRTGLLDTSPEQVYDDLVRLAADLVGVPIAAVHLVAADRQWSKAEIGLGTRNIPRDIAFCPTAMLEAEGLVVPDATKDPRFASNPLVTGGPGIRFYAGMPLIFEGLPVGALCVIDSRPREGGLDARQRFALKTLAAQVSSQIALRRALVERDRADALRRQTLNSATDFAIISTDLEGRVTGWNAGAENVLGWSEAEMLGQPAHRFFTPEDRAAGMPQVEMLQAVEGRRATDERWHQRRDGSCFWASGEMMALRDEQGGHIGYLKMLRDRTEQHLAGEALKAVNERFRLAQRATRDAIWDWNLEDNSVLWNEALEDAYGWTAPQVEATGDWWAAQIHAQDRARIDRSIHAVIAGTGTSWTDEYRFRRTDGSYAEVLDRGYVIRRPDGKAIRMIGAMLDLSERRRAEAALRESDERLHLTANAARIGTFNYQVQTGELAWDDRCRALFGLPPEAPLSYAGTFLAGLHPEDREMADRAVRQSMDPAGSGRFAAEYRTIGLQDGVERWISAQGRTEFENGAPVRLVGTVLDITDRKRAEMALRKNEARYQTLFNSMDDGFCIIEFIDGPHGPLSDYVHVEANPGYERHTGIANIVGRTIRGLAPDEADGWVELYGGVLRTGQPIRFERYFAAAGRYIEVSSARVEEAGQRQVSVLFRDVTARKRAAEALRASEAVARENIQRVQLALAAGAIIGTWFWDLQADRFTVDDAFARTFGLDPALGRVGLRFEQVVATVHPDDKPRLIEAVQAAIAHGGAYAHQYRVRRADGNYYWIEANGRVDHAPDGTPLSFPGVLIDVEERRAVEAERDSAAAALRALNETLEQRVAERTADLMRIEEQLRQSQKMEAVGQLTGGLAHDFNNLLTGIIGSIELLGVRVEQGRLKDLDRYVLAAMGAARRAAALTHRLLAFSRRQTLDPKPTDVNRLIAGMVDLVRRTVGPEITVEVAEADGLWLTLVDSSQLENALLNLCINARDAMPGGGRITIEMANKWLDDRAAGERDLPPGRYLSLCVTDTGTGMTPDVVARAFDPFFTTKPLGEGTGLGLSMIYGFVRQSGGQVRIYSEVGHGTTVCLYLPHYEGDAAELRAQPDLADAPRARVGETVLVVDDEATVRMLVTEVLEELGYAAVEAADGASGLKALQSSLRVDLLVTDVGLPGGMNGRQLADAARALRPELKVLFITGYAENAVIGNGHLEPGMHVLTKPFAMEALASRIKELIAS